MNKTDKTLCSFLYSSWEKQIVSNSFLSKLHNLLEGGKCSFKKKRKMRQGTESARSGRRVWVGEKVSLGRHN